MDGTQTVLYLGQDVVVEVGHVTLSGHGPIIVILEVLFQGHGVMWNVQGRVEIVRQHLFQKQRDYNPLRQTWSEMTPHLDMTHIEIPLPILTNTQVNKQRGSHGTALASSTYSHSEAN